jgi:hypothetical protein
MRHNALMRNRVGCQGLTVIQNAEHELGRS